MVRKSPIEHAKNYAYIIKIGNNKNLWVSLPDKNNIYKWKELSNNTNIYKIYTLFNKENKQNKIRYDNLIKNIKLLSKNLNIYYDQIFLSNILFKIETDKLHEWSIKNYLGDDGYYSKNLVNDILKNLIEKYKTDHFLVITDLDIYEYLQSKTLFLYGLIQDDKKYPIIIKSIKSIFNNKKIDIHYNKNIKKLTITILD